MAEPIDLCFINAFEFMVKRFIYMFVLLLVAIASAKAQTKPIKLGIWTLASAKGEINLNGLYREQERTLNTGLIDYPKNAQIAGGINLKTNSYFWHPNFMILGVDVDFNPEKRKDSYLIIPNRSEVRNMKNLKINATFFNKKEITINTFVNLNENFRNSENINNIETQSKKYGASVYYKNRIAPLFIIASKNSWNQTEHLSQRTFKNRQNNVEARISRQGVNGNNHEISYALNDYTRQNENRFTIHNTIGTFNLNNTFYIDSLNKYSFNSRINNFSQKGDNLFNRFQVLEHAVLKLPQNFRYNASYAFYNTRQDQIDFNQHTVKNKLSHQLFLSLKSALFVDYSRLIRDGFKETNLRSGVDFNYTKEIPHGNLLLNYKYYTQQQGSDNRSQILQIVNEEHILSDQEITMLVKPYVLQESVALTDITGTVAYQLNIDYIVILRNNYLEIQRLPGGQISDGSTVYIDYTVNLPDTYQYQSHNNSFTLRLSFFKRLIECYYTRNNQDFNHLQDADFIILNYYTQDVWGARVNKGPVSAGFEYDSYQSSLIPYKLKRAYIQVQGTLGEKILYALNGNLRDYDLLNEDQKQLFVDITGKITYAVSRQIKINMDVAYRHQKGLGLNMNLFTNRYEFIAQHRRLYFTTGLEFYNRDYLREKLNYIGADFKIARKF